MGTRNDDGSVTWDDSLPHRCPACDEPVVSVDALLSEMNPGKLNARGFRAFDGPPTALFAQPCRHQVEVEHINGVQRVRAVGAANEGTR